MNFIRKLEYELGLGGSNSGYPQQPPVYMMPPVYGMQPRYGPDPYYGMQGQVQPCIPQFGPNYGVRPPSFGHTQGHHHHHHHGF